MISWWVYRSSLCFWQLIPLGIWYNCLYRLGHSLLQFPIRYLRIVFGIVFMPSCCPWCPRVLGWVSTQPGFIYPSDTFQGSSHWAHLLLWGLLKVFLPKACMQWSLCRQSIAQSFEATAIGSVTRGKLDKYEKECDVWCVTVTRDCDRDRDLLLVPDWTYCWVLDFLELALT